MIGERSLGGVLYYHLARIYPDGESAKRVFDSLSELGKRAKGKTDLGVYRAIRSGDPAKPDEARVLIIVSLKRPGIEYASNVMGGEPYDGVSPHEYDSLMMRRVRVVKSIHDAGAMRGGGRLVIRRGKRAARLRPDGELEEQIGEG